MSTTKKSLRETKILITNDLGFWIWEFGKIFHFYKVTLFLNKFQMNSTYFELFLKRHVEMVNFVGYKCFQWKTKLADEIKSKLVLVQNGQSFHIKQIICIIKTNSFNNFFPVNWRYTLTFCFLNPGLSRRRSGTSRWNEDSGFCKLFGFEV